MKNTGSPPARSRLLPKLVLFALTLVLGVAMLEVVCRFLDVDFNPNPNWRFHAVLGWTQERSKDFVVDVGGEKVRVQFNSKGFRDVEHLIAKPPGQKRVVVLGDSFSEAIQVNIEDTYWYRLRGLLSEGDAESDWQVINLGVGDYGHAQSFLALTEFGLDFSPDLVLFQIFPLNDICNNGIELAGLCKSQNDLFRPYFVESGQNLTLTHVNPSRHWLRTRFISFGILEKTYLSLTQPQLVNDDLHRARYSRRGIPGDPLLYTFAEEHGQIGQISKAWLVTEMILRKVDELCRSRGIPWLPVVIPFEARLAAVWDQFSSGFQLVKLQRDYPEQRLGRLFEELEVPSVLLLDAFDRNNDVVAPYVGGHLNKAAHAITAEESFRTIRESGWLDRE